MIIQNNATVPVELTLFNAKYFKTQLIYPGKRLQKSTITDSKLRGKKKTEIGLTSVLSEEMEIAIPLIRISL